MIRINDLLFGGKGASTRLGDAGLAIVRVGIGLGLAFGHGYGKIFENGFGPNADLVSGIGDMGFPAPIVFAWLAALAEFVGGLLLAVGLLTRPVALVIAVNMAVAAFIAMGSAPLFSSGAGIGKEFPLLFLLPAVMFICTGGGRYSVDRLIR
jgi:putative oxidoreductase